jgi:hypothetical protein
MDIFKDRAIFSSAELQEMREACDSFERAYPMIDAKLCIVTWKMTSHRNDRGRQ